MSLWSFLVLFFLSQVAPSAYTDAMFRTALNNESTAPNYVLITVQDSHAKTSRVICVTANLFEGAIHLEYGLGYTASDELKAKDIMLSNKDRFFVFTKPEALKNIPIYYSENQLNEVRKILRSKTNDELIHGFDLQHLRQELAAGKPGSNDAFRDAIAHGLLERGILCGMGDMTDDIYVGSP